MVEICDDNIYMTPTNLTEEVFKFICKNCFFKNQQKKGQFIPL